MTGDRTLLRDIVSISSVSIKLPNHTFAHAVEEGNLVINNSVMLTHVLTIPSLDCNLLSFAKLTTYLGCNVLLSDRLSVL